MKFEARIGPGGSRVPPGSHFGGQSCRGLTNRAKMDVPGSPRPPPKWDQKSCFLIFFMSFFMPLSRFVFLRCAASFFLFWESKIEGKLARQGAFFAFSFHACFWIVFFYGFRCFFSVCPILRKRYFWCRTMSFLVWFWYCRFARML